MICGIAPPGEIYRYNLIQISIIVLSLYIDVPAGTREDIILNVNLNMPNWTEDLRWVLHRQEEARMALYCHHTNKADKVRKYYTYIYVNRRSFPLPNGASSMVVFFTH